MPAPSPTLIRKAFRLWCAERVHPRSADAGDVAMFYAHMVGSGAELPPYPDVLAAVGRLLG